MEPNMLQRWTQDNNAHCVVLKAVLYGVYKPVVFVDMQYVN